MYLPDESYFGLKGKCPECGHKFELHPVASEITDVEEPPKGQAPESAAVKASSASAVSSEDSDWPPSFEDSLDPNSPAHDDDDEPVNFEAWDGEEETFNGPNPFQLEQIESRRSLPIPEEFDEEDAEDEYAVSGMWGDGEEEPPSLPLSPTLSSRLPAEEPPSVDPQFTWTAHSDQFMTARDGSARSSAGTTAARDSSSRSETTGHFELTESALSAPVGYIAKLGRWCRRKPIVAALLAASAVSLVLGAAFFAPFAIDAYFAALDAKAQIDAAKNGTLSEDTMAPAQAAVKEQEDAERQRLAALKPFWPESPEACLSPDGTQAATWGPDGVVTLWDVETGISKHTFAPAKEPRPLVYRVLFNAEGSRLLTLSDDNIARVWDPLRNQFQHELPHESTIRHAAFCPIENSSEGAEEALPGICTLTDRNDLAIWDAETGTLLHSERDIGEVLTLSGTGTFALLVRDSKLVLFNVSRASAMKEWPLPESSRFPKSKGRLDGLFAPNMKGD